MEIVIDIRDMLAELIRKAWLIVIFIIVCAVAVGGAKYYKDYNNVSNVEENVKTEFSVEEQAAINAYIGLKQQLENQVEYMDDSVYMSLNPYNLYKTDIQYYIADTNEMLMTDLMYAYQFFVLNGGLVSELYEIDDSIETEYLQEIITMEKMSGSDNLKRNVMNITLYGNTQEDVERLAENVKQQVEQYHDNVSGTVGTHSLIFLNESTKLGSDTNIANTQSNALNNLLSLKKNVESTKESLSSAQLAEAEALDSKNVGDKETDTANVSVDNVSISKKYLVVGAAAGLILGILVILLRYLFSNTLKGVRDLQKMHGLSFLGSVSVRKKNLLDRLAVKIFGREPILNQKVEQKLLESQLLSISKNHSITEIALTGNEKLKNSKPISSLLESFAEKDVHVKWIGNLSEDPEAIEQLEKYHNVVFVEQLRKSHYESVFYNVKLCEEQGINILGYVVIA